RTSARAGAGPVRPGAQGRPCRGCLVRADRTSDRPEPPARRPARPRVTLPSAAVRARREPDYILVRADRCPASLVDDLRAIAEDAQELTVKHGPDDPGQPWLRLPREIAALYVGGASGPAA